MKKKLMMSLIAIVAAAGSLMAQTNRVSPVDEKTKAAVTKITQLGITEQQRVRAMRVFNYYYTQRAAATGSAEADINFRDNKLKNIFTEEQMAAFKTKFEAELN